MEDKINGSLGLKDIVLVKQFDSVVGPYWHIIWVKLILVKGRMNFVAVHSYKYY